jgi:hypothetical protein
MAQKSKCSTSVRSDFEITTFIRIGVKILTIPNDSASNRRMPGKSGHRAWGAGSKVVPLRDKWGFRLWF